MGKIYKVILSVITLIVSLTIEASSEEICRGNEIIENIGSKESVKDQIVNNAEIVLEDINEETSVAENFDEHKEQEVKNIDVIEENTKEVTQKEENTQEQIHSVPEQKVENSKDEVPNIPKCTETIHGAEVGNSNKWFNSKSDALSYYDSFIKDWGEKWEQFEIDSETYDKNCPYGYEVWTCPFCSKWTMNFYYR